MNPKLEIKIPRVVDGDQVVGVIICGAERHKCKNRIEDILSGRFRDPPKNEDSDEEPDFDKVPSGHFDGSNSGVRSGSTGMLKLKSLFVLCTQKFGLYSPCARV